MKSLYMMYVRIYIYIFSCIYIYILEWVLRRRVGLEWALDLKSGSSLFCHPLLFQNMFSVLLTEEIN